MVFVGDPTISPGTPSVQAGEALTPGMVAINADGKAYMANAATGAGQEAPAFGFCECTVESGAYVAIKRLGKVVGASALTPGLVVYLGEADGTVTDVEPSTAGDIIQAVGQAISATDFLLNIDPLFDTVAGGS
jgi:hypothetical protein